VKIASGFGRSYFCRLSYRPEPGVRKSGIPAETEMPGCVRVCVVCVVCVCVCVCVCVVCVRVVFMRTDTMRVANVIRTASWAY
jgi:hypothetical protein